jgi:cysteine desulfurase
MIYLDWAATSPPETDILAEAAALANSSFGNPSSKHSLGAQARDRLEEARARLAAAIGVPLAGAKENLVFTGSGSEADSIPLLAVLRSALNARRDGSIKALHVVASEIEHAAVYEEAHLLKSLGIEVSFINPEADGRIDSTKVAKSVRKDTALVAVMAVNNETGAIQPIAEISAALAAAAGDLGRAPPRFHVDAVQALGKLRFDTSPEGAFHGVSSAAFSAHKIRGPRGIGALWTREALEPAVVGGGQEEGLRPGTENLLGAWAFARSAETAAASLEERAIRARILEARLMSGLGAISGAAILPEGRMAGDERYSPYILSAAFPGLSGEVMVRALSDSGIAVSTGSACSSNSRRVGRRVLGAMGLGERFALSAIRISTGELTTEKDIDGFLEAASSLYRRLKT